VGDSSGAPFLKPEQFDPASPEVPAQPPRTLVIACGALARELISTIEVNRWSHLQVTALPAILHNRPERITPEVRRKIRANRSKFDRILCLYGDCGTGGALDAMLAEEGVERIEGAHCYAFYSGLATFDAMHEAEIGTFYLTDYLVRHFDRLVWTGLGLDRYPQLYSSYFGHYTRLMHLVQIPDPALARKAEAIAQRMNLPLSVHLTGLDGWRPFLAPPKHA
jgi:hypothetical protein